MMGFQIAFDDDEPDVPHSTDEVFIADEDTKGMKDLDAYMARGRVHGDLSNDQLQILFVRIFHELARASSFESLLTELHDAEGEYRLRHLDPPYALVKDEAENFIKRVSNVVKSIDRQR